MTVLALDSPPLVRLWFHAPAERLTMNKRYHWTARARLTKVWRQAGFVAARNHLLDPAGYGYRSTTMPLPPCAVRVTFGVPDNRRRDSHNTAPTVKAIIDGLVDAGFWKDDTSDYVIVVDPRFTKGDTSVIVECWPLGRVAA